MTKAKTIRGAAFAAHRMNDGKATAHSLHQPCPTCNEDCMTTGLVNLVYTFEICNCADFPQYPHLVERLWHRQCFVKAAGVNAATA